MNTVAITGATSSIGVSLVKTCLESGCTVIAFVHKNSQHTERLPKSDRLYLRELDLADMQKDIHLNGSCDAFFHLAWCGTDKASRENPDLQQNNIGYTLNALRLAKHLGCKKFIGAGSQAEYGPHKHALLSPKDKVCPNTAYGISKYAAGQLGAALARQLGIDFFWVRVFSVYGRYDREETMLRSALIQMKRGENCQFTEGTQIWDYLHSDDAAKAFFLIGKNAMGSRVYCLGCGKKKQLKDYIIEMKNAINPQLNLKFGEIPFKPGEAIGIYADISSLQEDTGWTPEINFASGIRNIITGSVSCRNK